MINNILIGIIGLLTHIVQFILGPINTLINQNIPQLSSAFSTIASLFSVAGTYVGWVRDSLFIDSETIALIIIVAGIRLSIPILVSGVKLAVKWWDSIFA